MKSAIRAAFMTLMLGLLCGAAPAARATSSRVIGYFAEWERRYTVGDIPADKLTHINYAFAHIVDGRIAMKEPKAATENFAKLRALKRTHPHLKTLISVGGWTDSDHFSDVALTEESRNKFADSCADFAAEHGFDGVDIDWEFPVSGGEEGNSQRPEDKRNFTLLLAELRKSLDMRGQPDGPRPLLTIAAPAAGLSRIELGAIHRLLDFINVMTYDFAGSWSAATGFNSALHPVPDQPEQLSIAGSVAEFVNAGVTREKIVVGVPFYARGWDGVKDVDHGLFQPHDGNSPDGTHESGYWSYRGLVHDELKKTQRFWHDAAEVPWLYDAERGLMISYDDPQSMKLKARFVRDERLGGVMFWELSGDDEKSSLLNALITGLRD